MCHAAYLTATGYKETAGILYLVCQHPTAMVYYEENKNTALDRFQ